MLRDTISIGQLNVNIKQDSNGILLFYDNSRSKYLSSSRESFSFGLPNRNISSNRWLMITSGIYSNLSGYRTYRNATITSLSVQTENLSYCTFYIRRNGTGSNIYPITLNNETGKSLDNLDENLNINDYLQCYLVINSGNVDYPNLLVELAWRE